MSKYNRKQKKVAGDEFVDFWTRLFTKAEPYARAIGIMLGSAVVVVFGVWGITAYFEHKAQASTEAWGRAVRIYDADLMGATNPSGKSDEENPVPRFKTDKERADATLAELDVFQKKYSSGAALEASGLLRAGVLYDLGRLEDAQAGYQKFLDSGAQLPILKALAREGLGLCAEARGKLDDALAAYRALAPENKAKPDLFFDRALYDQARVLTKKGDQKKAIELYKQLLAKVPQSPLKEDVQGKLTMLEGG